MAYSDSWESPCRRICRLNYRDECVGCGRTNVEIGNWPTTLTSDKIEINKIAKERLKRIKMESAGK